MIKKIVLGVLFVGLVGALVAGAVNRTAAKGADTNNSEQRGAGWARTQTDGAVLTAGAAGAQGRGGNGQATGVPGSNTPLAETEDHQWVALSGTVTSVDDTQMTVHTGRGEIVVADRPWSFALDTGFTAQPGDQVTLRGFYENETFEVGQLTNGDQVTLIREESGRPLWAGGRGAGRGRTG